MLDYFAEAAAHGPGRIVPDYGVEFVGLTVHDEGELPGRGAGAAHDRRARRRGAHGAREVRRRLRRRAQRRARGDRAQARRRRLAPTRGASWTCWSTPTSPTGARSARSTPRRATSCTSRARAATSAACTSTSARCADDDDHRVRQTPIEEIIRKANEILHPYSIDVKQVAWHSVYEVGHRVTDKFDDVDRRRGARPARLPHRRRVPHAQREGRAGHERVDAGRLQPRLEARPRAHRPQPRVAALDVLGRASAGRAAAHRLRPRVVLAHGAQARGDLRPAGARDLLPGDRRVPVRLHDAVRPVDAIVAGCRAPGARAGLPDRQAVQVGRGRARVRRQRRAPRPPRQGRRPLARLRVRRRAGRGRAVGAGRVGDVDVVAGVSDRPATRPPGADVDAVFDVKVDLPAALRRRRHHAGARALPARRPGRSG